MPQKTKGFIEHTSRHVLTTLEDLVERFRIEQRFAENGSFSLGYVNLDSSARANLKISTHNTLEQDACALLAKIFERIVKDQAIEVGIKFPKHNPISLLPPLRLYLNECSFLYVGIKDSSLQIKVSVDPRKSLKWAATDSIEITNARKELGGKLLDTIILILRRRLQTNTSGRPRGLPLNE